MGKYIWLPYFRGVVIKQMGLRITGVKKIKGLAIKYNSER